MHLCTNGRRLWINVDHGECGGRLTVIWETGGAGIHEYLPAVILDARLMGEADADESRIRLADQLKGGRWIKVGAQRDGA